MNEEKGINEEETGSEKGRGLLICFFQLKGLKP